MENRNQQCKNIDIIDRVKCLCEEKNITITELEEKLELTDDILKHVDQVAKYFKVSTEYITHGYIFQKFAPVNNAKISVYKHALDFAMEDKEIKNVAITGPYSAGKSSVLESYKAKHSKLKFIHLSLAHFQPIEDDELCKSEAETESRDKDDKDELYNKNSIKSKSKVLKESIIEGKILNQLIHQIPADKIPQSNFRTKKDVNNAKLKQTAAIITCFIIGMTILMFASNIMSFSNMLSDGDLKNMISFIVSPAIVGLSLIMCPILAGYFIYLLLQTLKNKNILKKINFQGNGIEIFEDSDDSYFDKYLNEVLYLFENIEADVIVFEDMDRFNNNNIFIRLREINMLVNIQRKKEIGINDIPLKFVYLLRDDIFVSKDRTKFFDFIIPIIPVVDSSNSYDVFIENLKNAGMFDVFDHGFLEGLSLYIDDMRILKNIYNEFVIYFNILNITDLDCNKMMAIITYKNMFPQDFSDLQLCKGFIYQLFNNEKGKLIKEKTESLKCLVEELNMRIKDANNEMLQSIEELENIYYANQWKSQRSQIHPNEFNKFLEKYNSEKPKREQAIKDKEKKERERLETEIAKNKKEISIIAKKSLKYLLSSENNDLFFDIEYEDNIGYVNDYKIIKRSDYFDLLKYLVREGHINETYSDYLTYFHENRISINDKKFLQRITGRKGADYTYSLNKAENVMKSAIIVTERFEQVETLNFDLLEYLLENENESNDYEAYIKTLIKQIETCEKFDFISGFYEELIRSETQRNFVRKINQLWPSFFSEVIEKDGMTVGQIRQFSIDTLYYSDSKMIDTINKAASEEGVLLTEYISYSVDYLEIRNPEIDMLINAFHDNGVLFHLIDPNRANPELFLAVYNEELYELNYRNIAMILRENEEYQVNNENDIKHKNLTMILRKPKSPLAGYVLSNMPIYMSIILNNCDGRIDDDESVVIYILNDNYLAFSNMEENKIDDDKKRKYINALKTKINEIDKINDINLWTDLVEYNSVQYSVYNIIQYFIKFALDMTLVEFINKKSTEIDFATVTRDFGEEIQIKFFDAISICNEIKTEKYKKILLDLDCEFDNFEAAKIDDDKFEVLIENELLGMNEPSLGYVREKYHDHLFLYIYKNLDKYIEMQNDEICIVDEVIEILKWNDVCDDKKLSLLLNTKEKISVVENIYSDAVCAYLIKNNRSKADESVLYKEYSNYGNLTQNAIVELAMNLVQEIISRKMDINDLLLSELLKADKINRANKIALLINSSEGMEERIWKKHFDELGLKELKNVFKRNGSQIKYDINEEISEILEVLKNSKLIYDFKIEEDDPEKYLVIKQKTKITEILD